MERADSGAASPWPLCSLGNVARLTSVCPSQVYDTSLSTSGGNAYAAYFHPEFFEEGGRVMMISVCIGGAGDSKPYLAKIELQDA